MYTPYSMFPVINRHWNQPGHFIDTFSFPFFLPVIFQHEFGTVGILTSF